MRILLFLADFWKILNPKRCICNENCKIKDFYSSFITKYEYDIIAFKRLCICLENRFFFLWFFQDGVWKLFKMRHSLNKTERSIPQALKWSIFILQKLALHRNGFEFSQQFNGAIGTSLTTPYDDVRRHATWKKNRNAQTYWQNET